MSHKKKEKKNDTPSISVHIQQGNGMIVYPLGLTVLRYFETFLPLVSNLQ